MLNANYVGPLKTCIRPVGPCACKLLATHPPSQPLFHACISRQADDPCRQQPSQGLLTCT